MSTMNYEVGIRGRSLLMHNGQTADPLNKFAKAMKAVTAVRKKTDAEYEKLAKIEFQAGLYLDASGTKVIVPGRVLEAAIAEGAKKVKEGKSALAALFVDSDMALEYAGGPLTPDELAKSDKHRLTVGVRVSQARVMRTRPYFEDWSGTFRLSFDDSLANPEQVHTWITRAGELVGLGDWRPRHGRFVVTKFSVLRG